MMAGDISKASKLLNQAKDKYFGERLDFRARVFNSLGLIGIALSVFFAAFSYFVLRAGAVNASVYLLIAAIALLIIRRANSSGHFSRYFLITVIVVFIAVFPVLFFMGDGYGSGMPSFFVFAVAFTVLMLEGKRRIILASLELLLYTACFLVAYNFPHVVTPYPTDVGAVQDIIVGCLIASLALAAAIFQHIVVYDRKQKQLEQLDEERAKLFGNISHEMKTPLAIISTHAQLMRNKLEQLPEAQGSIEDALLIISEANQLGMIVTQALEYARIQEGGMKWSMKPCHVGEIIAEAVSMHFAGPSSANNHNRIDLKVNEGLPPIMADSRRIAQVVVNLVTNAVRHTKGGVITIAATERDKQVVLSVTDTGSGMTKEEIGQIFDRWHTGSGDTGTGLGLYICRNIAESHGGSITVESEPGKGTCFEVLLPVA
ncbi:MAG: HAMP domain-containing histidine kinase [Oscillospiraceae bacterium]|nr:HAMP domain-containing histidine kinase [Oscillospiraceae bacterium]